MPVLGSVVRGVQLSPKIKRIFVFFSFHFHVFGGSAVGISEDKGPVNSKVLHRYHTGFFDVGHST